MRQYYITICKYWQEWVCFYLNVSNELSFNTFYGSFFSFRLLNMAFSVFLPQMDFNSSFVQVEGKLCVLIYTAQIYPFTI